MRRSELLKQVRERLDGRRLVYFGTRGADAEGVGDLPELSAVFSIIGAARNRLGMTSAALEDMSGRRVDLDAFDIDEELQTPEVVELRRAILRMLYVDSVVFTYRPSTFLSAICFARQERCQYIGMFTDHQAAFEHKPWVESSIRASGIPAIPWTYIADEDQLDTLDLLKRGSVMLRTSRSTGGTGLTKVDSSADLADAWPGLEEAFVSVAPFIDGGTPANVSGVVWHDGVTLHSPSVQIIGVPQCTVRPFGYCGNDFEAMKQVEVQVVDQMERSSMFVGEWLRSKGYVGAFGVDFLIVEGQALFTEVNPRLQGVTHLACQRAAMEATSCVMLEHVAAGLGIAAPPSVPLREQIRSAPTLAHVVVHWTGEMPTTVDGERLLDEVWQWREVRRADLECPSNLTVEPSATVVRLTVDSPVTEGGFDLVGPWGERLSALTRSHLESVT